MVIFFHLFASSKTTTKYYGSVENVKESLNILDNIVYDPGRADDHVLEVGVCYHNGLSLYHGGKTEKLFSEDQRKVLYLIFDIWVGVDKQDFVKIL